MRRALLIAQVALVALTCATSGAGAATTDSNPMALDTPLKQRLYDELIAAEQLWRQCVGLRSEALAGSDEPWLLIVGKAVDKCADREEVWKQKAFARVKYTSGGKIPSNALEGAHKIIKETMYGYGIDIVRETKSRLSKEQH